jgi:hypothetical protein
MLLRQKCASVAAWMIFGTSFLAYGNSGIDPIDQGLSTTDNVAGAAIANRPMMTSGKCVLFRSTLQAVREEGVRIPDTDRKGSHPLERNSEPGGVLSLPEPGTGSLLGIGLLLIILAFGLRALLNKTQKVTVLSTPYTGNTVWARQHR